MAQNMEKFSDGKRQLEATKKFKETGQEYGFNIALIGIDSVLTKSNQVIHGLMLDGELIRRISGKRVGEKVVSEQDNEYFIISDKGSKFAEKLREMRQFEKSFGF